MKLVDLLKNIKATGISQDSRTFKPGDVFIAIKGEKHDGHIFVPSACNNGASAVVVENEDIVPKSFKGVVVKVENSRQAFEILAATFYGFPSEKMFVAGVTGTNGKTSITYMIESLLNPEKPTAVMGTIDNHFGKNIQPSTHTTPDALKVQKLFREWIDEGAQAVSMEVTSHAISMHRADSVHFDVAVFTNLTRDHLDFHKTMEEYGKVKSELFFRIMDSSHKKSKRNILNADDPYHKLMINPKVPTWLYGQGHCDLQIQNINLTMDYSQFELKTPMGTQMFRLPMIGLHNVYNAAASIGVGLHAGFSLSELSRKLSKLTPVKGRLQRVNSKNSVRTFIDYAHTDDALLNVLTFLKKLRDEFAPQNKIITVFGCGGDRDKGKRPLMFAVARRFSNLVIVTSDNPRTEDPASIIRDIIGQTKVEDSVLVEVDRRKAIELAIKKADPGDVVLIAGKGHEDYQIIGTQKFPFDDYKIAQEVLEK